MQVLTLILILVIGAYLALLSLVNKETYQLTLWFGAAGRHQVYTWQLLAGGVVAGMLVALLAIATRRGEARKRLSTVQHELRQALAAAEDYRKRLANAEAENQRLAQQLKELRSAGPGGAEAPSGEGGHIG